MIEITIPYRIRSEANIFEHWTKKHKRKRIAKDFVIYHLNPYEKPTLPCVVTITRIAPRKLDYDNLVYACKYIIDSVCSWILPGLEDGQADSDPRIQIKYKQEKSGIKEYGTKIKIESL